MDSKKISVIVPIYKVEDYLEKCITSIINQTYKNLEIILVDDGSPDNCGKICDEFAKFDNRIKVIHKSNGGLSSARNAGLDICTGEFISFIDSDDWIDNRLYENIINVINKDQVDIIEFKSINVYDRNDKLDVEDTNNYEKFNNVEALRNHFNSKYFHISAWSKVYKKELFKDIRFPEGKLAEDLYTTYKLFYKSKNVGHIDYTGYYYYIREGSIMGSNSSKLMCDVFKGIKEEHQFIYENIPELKSEIDKIYINCLLKSYAYFNKQNTNSMIASYKNEIQLELERKDIEIRGRSKGAFILYKISPIIFTIIINFIFNRKRR